MIHCIDVFYSLDQLAAKTEDKLRRLSADWETIRMYQLREKFLSDQKIQLKALRTMV